LDDYVGFHVFAPSSGSCQDIIITRPWRKVKLDDWIFTNESSFESFVKGNHLEIDYAKKFLQTKSEWDLFCSVLHRIGYGAPLEPKDPPKYVPEFSIVSGKFGDPKKSMSIDYNKILRKDVASDKRKAFQVMDFEVKEFEERNQRMAKFVKRVKDFDNHDEEAEEEECVIMKDLSLPGHCIDLDNESD